MSTLAGMHQGATASPRFAAFASGTAIAFLDNIAKNLPVAVVAGTVVRHVVVSQEVTGALLVGVDLGPNLSVTGSLATILWLAALWREGLRVNGWAFLKVGAVVMPPALLLSVATLVISR
jgi:arsenical pump membrane protein